MDEARIETLTRQLLEAIGEDPDRQGLRRTPARVAALYRSLFRGVHQDLASCLHPIAFVPDLQGHMSIVLRDIPFYSMCEHHFVPFFGKMSVAFVPGTSTVGLRDVVRLLDLAAARLQLQERLTAEISQAIDERLHPRALVVRAWATHLCMDLERDTRSGGVLQTCQYAGDSSLWSTLESAMQPASRPAGTIEVSRAPRTTE